MMTAEEINGETAHSSPSQRANTEDSAAAGQEPGGGDEVSFAGLLDVLGVGEHERISVCTQPPGGVFSGVVPLTRADAVGVACSPLPKADHWFSVNTLSVPEGYRGRGTVEHVARCVVSVGDFDVKPGRAADLEAAMKLARRVSDYLGCFPVAFVRSGYGLHVYWLLDGDDPAWTLDSEEKRAAAQAIYRRAYRLALMAAIEEGWDGLDNTSDLSRVMRVPLTQNYKDPDDPKPVSAAWLDPLGPHGVLSYRELDEALDALSVTEMTGEREVFTTVVFEPQKWEFSAATTPYVQAMVTGWATDEPEGARHDWLLSQCVRLAAAHRTARISKEDYEKATGALIDRFGWLVENGQGRYPRALDTAEVLSAITWATGRVAAMSDERAAAEVGGDENPTTPTGAARSAGDGSRFFGREGLLVRDLAGEVMRRVECGVGEVDDRFYVYEGGVWVPNRGRVEEEIVALLGNRYRNAHSRNVLDLIRYSRGTTRITCGPTPDYVNVPNGMVSWADGTLLPHSPDHRSTVQLPVAYDPDAACPRFEKFLAEVLPKDLYEPDGESPGFIWELIGYTIYSGNPLHIAVLLYGKGRNGKGTLIRVLKRLLGDRNCSTVSLHQLVENRFRAAQLFGKLANLAGDLDSRWLDNTAVFKAVTGGDTIQGEHKYGTPFDFLPWALPFYSANKAFGSADSSEGWVARWLVVPFPASFIGREDRELDAKLQTEDELRGILRRGIRALPSLMRRGRFTEPKSVREAKTAFVIASDPVRAWLHECCVAEFEAWTPRKDLHSAYWAHTNSDGSKQLSSREFYNRIEQVNGIHRATRQGVRGFAGIRLRTDSDGPPADAVPDVEDSPSDSDGKQGAKGANLLPPPATHGEKG